ncbi:MAG: chemotaxis protein CheD [Synergistaceae bacterium]|nr:chemotaxis protein CheD [Synergistota bacterium]NLM70740.1 chemotaxis protein CheD [Synergistaceae bacterium]
MRTVRVGIAEAGVVVNPDSITTLGLGSCVGVTMYDERRKIGGMVHVMLPSTELAKGDNFNKSKFADSGVPDLVDRMVRFGADRRRLVAKLAGGAQMFNIGGSGDSILKIGARNTEACKRALASLGIPIISEDTGGSWGRTIVLFADTGILEVRTIGRTKTQI